MVRHGAAVKVADEELSQGVLGDTLECLLADRERRQAMSRNARQLARPNATTAIAEQLVLLAGGR
jgi:UDP-N-acetylglucosamine:LPS N-acetylglucosamine transferase